MNIQKDPLKAVLLDMFAWFHEFCVEHGLRYYMLGGTMLGAVRHQGFIPWDDDIDVGMPRQDYIQLEELLKNREGEKYILETPNSGRSDYFYPGSKLYDTTTTLVENTRYKIKRGVYIDIFPLDGAGESKEESFVYFKPIQKKLNLLLTLTAGIRPGRKFYKNVAIRVLRAVPKWLIDPQKLLKDIALACQNRNFESYTWGGNLVGVWREKELVMRAWFGNPTLYKFEGMCVYGVEDYDSYLTGLYGNWRELPPIEKRVSHHDFIEIDLNKSYLSNDEG